MTSDNKLRITFENHGRTNIAEMPFDVSLPEIMRRFCDMLVASGWSRENVASLFNEEEGYRNPFEWDIV